MAIRPILRLGHPVLRSPADRVPPEHLERDELQTLLDDLVETLRDSGGVGLAAPQVGEPLQVFAYEVDPERHGAAPSDPETSDAGEPDSGEPNAGDAEAEDAEAEGVRPAIPLRILINPMVEPHARELVYDWEGCLSIPGLRGLVPRYPEVKVDALDRDGNAVSFLATGFEARIIQHEFDHLNGVVYLDRMRDLRSLSYEEEWQEFMAPSEIDPSAVAVE